MPLLDAMLPRVEAAPSQFEPVPQSLGRQPRLICCYIPNGVNILGWVPTTAGAGYELSPTLKTLADCRERANSSRFGGEYGIPLGGFYASNG